MKYTYSDEEEEGSDANSARRSNRQSGLVTPAEPAGPTFTASGRQVRSRVGGAYGEKLLSGQETDRATPAATGAEAREDTLDVTVANGRLRRSGARQDTNGRARSGDHIEGYNLVDEMEDEDDAASSEGEWEAGDDEADEQADDDIEEPGDEVSDEASDMDRADDSVGKFRSLVVQLRYQKNSDTNASLANGNSRPNHQSRPSRALPVVQTDTMANGYTPKELPRKMESDTVTTQLVKTDQNPSRHEDQSIKSPSLPPSSDIRDIEGRSDPSPMPPTSSV